MSRAHWINKIKSLVVVTSGATVVFGGLSLMKGNVKFYDEFLMPLVHQLPPETTHRLGVFACKYKLFPKLKFDDPKLLETVFYGHKITNPIGLAAGFDKHGEAVEGLQRLGFGFIEIGSVTPLPQEGNPKPRVFRLPLDKAVLNRYGFNSEGHGEVYRRLKKLKEKNNFKGVLGVNLGKNKTSPDASNDYVKGVELFGPIADYLVINVSSPNTPGLRSLQSKNDLKKLLSAVISARNNLSSNCKVPVLLKLAPDLTTDDLRDIVSVIQEKKCNVDGLIISNTTVDKSNLKTSEFRNESGGLSGAPLKEKSTQLIALVYSMTQGTIPIIGVGGIFSGQDAFEKIEAGASFIQLYTSLVYHGPPILVTIKKELSELLETKGYGSIAKVVGTNYQNYLKNEL